jgi:hypothetical protein
MSHLEEKAVGRIYIDKLTHLVYKFQEKIKAGIVDSEHFLTMSEIEQLWSDLRGNSNIIYSDMLQDILSSVDESDLIRKKKRIPKQRNNSTHEQTVCTLYCNGQWEY